MKFSEKERVMTEEEKRLELWKQEYNEVSVVFRFFAGFRFAFLASFSAFFGIAMGAYNYVWTSEAKFLDFWGFLLWAVPFFGFVVTITGWLIERRTVILYQTCLRRGQALEQEMNVEEGVFHQLITSVKEFYVFGVPVTHTLAISSLYFGVGGIWIVLFSYGMYKMLLKY